MSQIGYCGCGCDRNLTLGDTDCDGVPVGYIDNGGLSWESRLEHDTACTSGRFMEAVERWGGGEAMPSILWAMIEADAHLDNYDACREACYESLKFFSLCS